LSHRKKVGQFLFAVWTLLMMLSMPAVVDVMDFGRICRVHHFMYLMDRPSARVLRNSGCAKNNLPDNAVRTITVRDPFLRNLMHGELNVAGLISVDVARFFVSHRRSPLT
jgi:hypothetical protein